MNNIILILLAIVLLTLVIYNIYELYQSHLFYKRLNIEWYNLRYLDRSKEYYEFKYDMEFDDNGQ